MSNRPDAAGNDRRLYFGDNLEILRGNAIRDGSIDLIYLDPPFNSQAEYNVLFKRPGDDATSAQAGAFLDTWTWGEEAELSYDEIMKLGGGTAKFIDALRAALGKSDMMAYLVMMAVRLQALRDKLKSTGSLYLHCDPTASHYLKVILDGTFGPENFRNEIIWKRTGAHSAAKRWADVHDVILFYSQSRTYTWNKVFTPYDEAYLSRFKRTLPDGRRWYDDNLTAPGVRHGASGTEWKGFNPTDKGNHWKVSASTVVELLGEEAASKLSTIEKLNVLDEHGLIYWPDDGGFPRFKRLVGQGMPLQDVVTDIAPLNSQASERLGYPTQKPLTLLDRIIRSSSNEGETVFDPFCGCGTTIDAAQRAGRKWIGIDIAIHAIKVIEARLAEQFPGLSYGVEGIPRDFASAVRLAEADKYQFQWWANYLFNPHALREQKKGMDRGVDGDLFFPNGPGRPWGRMLTSVKGGENVGPSMVRDFARVIDREQAELGLFICLRKPTKEMQREAISAGFADTVHGSIPKLQIVAIEDWFLGKMPKLPPLEHLPSAAFATPKRRGMAPQRPDQKQPQLPLSYIGGKGKLSSMVHLNRNVVHVAELKPAPAPSSPISPPVKAIVASPRRRLRDVRKEPELLLPISGPTKDLPLDEPLLIADRRPPARLSRRKSELGALHQPLVTEHRPLTGLADPKAEFHVKRPKRGRR